MCGIAGIINFNSIPVSRELVKQMADSMRHRGPDGEGFFYEGHVALGHRRLAIIDLSDNAKQPMSNEDGSIWLVFNGEIYNFKDLRAELKARGHKFRSNTDSEVIIHAYEEYGEDCVKRFNGMWAFALWDKKKRRIFASRDRFGIKPFYYYLDANRFVFASEIKAILQDGSIPRSPNGQVIFDFLAFENNDYIDHNEDSFFAGIKRLMPAHNLILDLNGTVSIKRYWDIEKASTETDISDADAAGRFYELFEDSVRLRLQSDVPVGTCLSGGLDSSSIVCVINKLIKDADPNCGSVGGRQKTFSACFTENYCDESKYLDAVIAQTGVDAYKIFPKDADLFGSVSEFLSAQGEPVAGTSQWAGWLVMKLASENGVKVVLNGQGADEILAGYSSYFFANAQDLAKKFHFKQFRREIDSISASHGYPKSWLYKKTLGAYNPIHPLRWLRKAMGKEAQSYPEWLNPEFVEGNRHRFQLRRKFSSNLDNSLYHFLTIERLPSLLRYEDRNSMAFSLESRLPFLDYRLAEYCFALPASQKVRDGTGKIVLKNALDNMLPQIVRQRKNKIGFVTPEREWFRNKYISAIREVISLERANKSGYFDVDMLNAHFERFADGSSENLRPIWKYINFKIWLDGCVKEKSSVCLPKM